MLGLAVKRELRTVTDVLLALGRLGIAMNSATRWDAWLDHAVARHEGARLLVRGAKLERARINAHVHFYLKTHARSFQGTRRAQAQLIAPNRRRLRPQPRSTTATMTWTFAFTVCSGPEPDPNQGDNLGRRLHRWKLTPQDGDEWNGATNIADTSSAGTMKSEERSCAFDRVPIVLCYLQGMTHDHAASELGWPVGTVRGRLARGRDMLRTRLTRCGLTLFAGFVAAAGPLPETVAAALPAALVNTTVRAALGPAAAGVLTAPAAALLQAVLRKKAPRSVRQLAMHAASAIALVKRAAALLAGIQAEQKLSGERTSIARKFQPVRPAGPDFI